VRRAPGNRRGREAYRVTRFPDRNARTPQARTTLDVSGDSQRNRSYGTEPHTPAGRTSSHQGTKSLNRRRLVTAVTSERHQRPQRSAATTGGQRGVPTSDQLRAATRSAPRRPRPLSRPSLQPPTTMGYTSQGNDEVHRSRPTTAASRRNAGEPIRKQRTHRWQSDAPERGSDHCTLPQGATGSKPSTWLPYHARTQDKRQDQTNERANHTTRGEG
jgi:hypothetical protein